MQHLSPVSRAVAFLLLLCGPTILAAEDAASTGEAGTLSLNEALRISGVYVEISRRTNVGLQLHVKNGTQAPLALRVDPGLVFTATTTEAAFTTLRSARLNTPAKGEAKLDVRAVWLSSKSGFVAADTLLQPGGRTPAQVGPVLKHLASRPDIAPPTSQLLVFIFLENLTFREWQQFLVRIGSAERTTAIISAIEALSIAREIAPGKEFALANDASLKLQALREPRTRAKAMHLYGMALPAEPGYVAPEIGALLHTKLGDDCSMCRTRAQMQRGTSDL
jgi:hypothetical protein